MRLGLIFAMINIVGVEFLINFGGLGQLINELAERYDLPGTYAAICFVVLVSVRRLHRHRAAGAMAETGQLTLGTARSRTRQNAVTRLRRDHRARAGGVGSAGVRRAALPRRGAVARRHRPRAVERWLDGSRIPSSICNLGRPSARSAVAPGDRRLCGLGVGIVLGANRLLRARLRVAISTISDRRQDHFLSGDDHVVRRRLRLEDGDGRDLVFLSDRDQRRRAACARSTSADPRRTELPRGGPGR